MDTETPLIARRRLLKAAGYGLGLAGMGLTPVGQLLARAGSTTQVHGGYGPLKPVRDLNTGLPLLRLPEGFRYTTFGWAGEALAGDIACPGKHDGMGVVRADGDVVTLVRNHEIGGETHGSFTPAGATWDPDCAGGTSTLRFDTAAGRLLEARPSLSGTLVNCAGGVTPWGTWLSCEEIVLTRGQVVQVDGVSHTMRQSHGYVFEVPAEGLSTAEPIVAMGRFKHEAATIDPSTGIVYLTEDGHRRAGFYRMLPAVPGELLRGGRLQMLAAEGAPDLRRGRRQGERLKVRWVEIEQPDQDHDGKAEPHRARMEHARLQHQWCAGKQHQREAGPLRLQMPQRSGEERLGGRTSCKRRVGQYGCHPPTFVLSLRPDVTPRMVAGRLIVAGAVLALDMPHLDVI